MCGLITKDMYCLKKNLKIFFSVTIGIMVLSVLFIISSKYGNVARGMAQMQREEKFGNKIKEINNNTNDNTLLLNEL